MKIVVDTNVIFSAIFFLGLPSKILDNILDGYYEIVLSEEIVAEYKQVINRYSKKKNSPNLPEIMDLIEILVSGSLFIDANNIVTPPCADPDDVKFLQAAIVTDAQYLISGDVHLLDVGVYPGGEVLTPRDFLDLV